MSAVAPVITPMVRRRQRLSSNCTAPEERSLADEALAHVYAATASLALGDLDAAVADLEPILGLPPERRISWIKRRLDRISGMLSGPPYAGAQLAATTLDRIRSY